MYFAISWNDQYEEGMPRLFSRGFADSEVLVY